MTPLADLAEHLAEQRLALFVGADMAQRFTGLPSRADVAGALARRKGLSESLSLAAVAQRVMEQGNRWEFTEFLKRQWETTGKSPQRFHELLVRLPVPILVTTAYDDLLRRAFEQAGEPLNVLVQDNDVPFVQARRRTLLRLYGDLAQPDTLIVTEDDHYHLGNKRLKENLLDRVSVILRENVVLFVGYNLVDPDFLLFWNEALARMAGYSLGGYALWPGLPESEQRVWKGRHIKVIDEEPLPFLEKLLATTGQGAATISSQSPIVQRLDATNKEQPSPPSPSRSLPKGETSVSLNPDLLGRLRETLLRCGPFDDFPALRDLFVDPRIRPWRDRLRESSAPHTRVNGLIADLQDQANTQGENALVLFLLVLIESLPAGIECRKQLGALAVEMGYVGELGEQGSSEPRRDIVIDKAVSPGPTPLPTRLIEQRWALLVGINEYDDPAVPDLCFCINDVVALEAQLTALGYTVITLRDDAPEPHLQPTKENIEARLSLICQSAGENDLILLHLACHGKLLEGKPVLITKNTHLIKLSKHALPLAEVEAELRASKARRRVLFLDACHVGVKMGRAITDPEFIHNVHDLAEGFSLIAASTSQQIAQESHGLQHGVFTYYLLKGLDRAADRERKDFVTVHDIAEYTLHSLRQWNVKNSGVIQEPTSRIEGIGDMILADYRPPS
ncbi:MAG: SIR2 family protein [Ardenticatenales bacterium]|nr:SIR2 family protein [Ardenticatenales bacterium]